MSTLAAELWNWTSNLECRSWNGSEFANEFQININFYSILACELGTRSVIVMCHGVFLLQFWDHKVAWTIDKEIIEWCSEVRATFEMNVIQAQWLKGNGFHITQIARSQSLPQSIDDIEYAFARSWWITRTGFYCWS